jgi:hypothetical protein
MKLSNQAFALKKAHKKGYSVCNDGTLLGPKGELVAGHIDEKGYETFNISFVRGGKKIYRPIKVHRLQAYQKYGDRMLAKKVHCRHLDGNKRNNSKDNIYIGDAADNRADFLRLTKGRRSKSVTIIKKSFGRYQLLLKKKVVN